MPIASRLPGRWADNRPEAIELAGPVSRGNWASAGAATLFVFLAAVAWAGIIAACLFTSDRLLLNHIRVLLSQCLAGSSDLIEFILLAGTQCSAKGINGTSQLDDDLVLHEHWIGLIIADLQFVQ